MRLRVAFATCLSTALFSAPILADVGVFTGNGQNLRQVTTKTIHLASIDVVIVLGRGRFLFDGGVPGMDSVDFECKFVLQSTTGKKEEVQIGFPIDSQFAGPPYDREKQDPAGWVLNYGFIARDENTTYHVDFVRPEGKAKGRNLESRALFVWKMNFAANETKTLNVRYRIPMSMTLHNTRKDGRDVPEDDADKSSNPLRRIEECFLEASGYMTETGSSWAGNVEKATFTLITKPFERYLDRRGLIEQSVGDMPPEEAARFQKQFPVQHPWWFRQISPEGWKETEEGIRWEYHDFKPKDPISVRYYETQIPRLAQEVDPYVEGLRKAVQESRHGGLAAEMEIEKQILLATFGKEPVDRAARDFVKDQVWYTPKKNFSMSDLSKGQQCVIDALDRRMAAETKKAE